MTISRIHKRCVDGKAKEKNRFYCFYCYLWLHGTTEFFKQLWCLKIWFRLPVPLNSNIQHFPTSFHLLKCFSPNPLLYQSPNHIFLNSTFNLASYGKLFWAHSLQCLPPASLTRLQVTLPANRATRKDGRLWGRTCSHSFWPQAPAVQMPATTNMAFQRS